ncbi:hypothetical protein SLS54_010764 [Diplodia seriata]
MIRLLLCNIHLEQYWLDLYHNLWKQHYPCEDGDEEDKDADEDAEESGPPLPDHNHQHPRSARSSLSGRILITLANMTITPPAAPRQIYEMIPSDGLAEIGPSTPTTALYAQERDAQEEALQIPGAWPVSPITAPNNPFLQPHEDWHDPASQRRQRSTTPPIDSSDTFRLDNKGFLLSPEDKNRREERSQRRNISQAAPLWRDAGSNAAKAELDGIVAGMENLGLSDDTISDKKEVKKKEGKKPIIYSCSDIVPSESRLAVEKNLRKKLKESPNKSDRAGCIYIMVSKSRPGLVKIGKSIDPDKRVSQLVAGCHLKELRTVYVRRNVNYHARVESLVHLHLKPFNETWYCSHWKKGKPVEGPHREWFHCEPDFARTVVDAWADWISLDPYADDVLEGGWAKRVKEWDQDPIMEAQETAVEMFERHFQRMNGGGSTSGVNGKEMNGSSSREDKVGGAGEAAQDQRPDDVEMGFEGVFGGGGGSSRREEGDMSGEAAIDDGGSAIRRRRGCGCFGGLRVDLRVAGHVLQSKKHNCY